MTKPRPREKRQKPLSPPLSVREFDALARETWLIVLSSTMAYRRAHEEQGWPPGGSGLHTTGGDPSDATVAAVTASENRDRRQACLNGIAWLRQARAAAENAVKALEGVKVEQPETVDKNRATLTQEQFDRALHRKRERELRADS